MHAVTLARRAARFKRPHIAVSFAGMQRFERSDSFWEISRDVVRTSPMIKYSYLEKGVTSTSVLIAYFSRNVPAAFLVGIAITDMIWIPLFIWVHLTITRMSPAQYTKR